MDGALAPRPGNAHSRAAAPGGGDDRPGGKALPQEAVEQAVARTDGVPLFVEELTKMVLESGLLQEREGSYELTAPLPALAIPARLHDSLMARLYRLAAVRAMANSGPPRGASFRMSCCRPSRHARAQEGCRPSAHGCVIRRRYKALQHLGACAALLTSPLNSRYTRADSPGREVEPGGS